MGRRENSLWPVAVKAQILQILPQQRRENKNLFLRPPHGLLEQPHRHTLEIVQQVILLPSTDKLQTLIAGPGAARHLEDFLDNVLEAASLEPSPPAARVVDGGAEFFAGDLDVVGHDLQMRIFGDASVVAFQDAGDALELDPTTWFEMSARAVSGQKMIPTGVSAKPLLITLVDKLGKVSD